ncbi:MAG: serine/threonine protein kinase [Lachnospiraceae bacterium]|nr:serine/threonine protein kinase [Lachnospiraceae bacterium]
MGTRGKWFPKKGGKKTKAGIILFEKYKLIKKTGEGNGSEVYVAEHVKLHTLRAVKCVQKDKIPYEKLIKEAVFLKSLHHPAIPILYDAEEDEQYFYLMEEYIEGESIKSMLHRHKQFSTQEIITYGIQLCEIISYLHSQNPYPIIHGDISPGNILIRDKKCYLLDFGNAVQITGREMKGDIYGTPQFVEPEQQGERSCNVQVDIYAVCALLYAVCPQQEGKKGFFSMNSKQKKLEKILCKGMGDKRYENIHELHDRLLELKGQPLTSGAHQMNQTNKSITVTIGCIGITPACGVTTITLRMVQVLSKHKTIAFLQFGEQKDLGRYKLWQQEQGIYVETIRYGFRCQNIDFYPMVDSQQLLYVLNAGYEIIVIDFGQADINVSDENAIKEFQQCNRKIILGNYCIWNYEQSIRRLEHLMDGMCTRDWIYGSLSNDKRICNLLEHKLGISIIRSSSPENESLYDKIIQRAAGYSKDKDVCRKAKKYLQKFTEGIH